MSCEAAESVEDAVLRMARVNCNNFEMEKETRFAYFRHSTAYDSRVEGECQAFFEAAEPWPAAL